MTESVSARTIGDAPHTFTRVIFRTWLDTGAVDAILLDVEANPGCVTCYSHVGQHSEGKYFAVMGQTRPARAEEYEPLLRELQSIGYRLIIKKRRNVTRRRSGVDGPPTYYQHPKRS